MKKLVSALLAVTIIMSPIGSTLFNDHATTVEAKGYKSGKKSFNTNNNSYNKPAKVDKKQEDNASFNKQAKPASSKGGFFSGGLMRGLFVGGLAGLLFGSLFANMGILGSLLGFMINMLAIVLIISIIRKIFVSFKKRKEEVNPWRS
ncbi:hypothetical protein NCCP2222_38760 [Sporosarcina sp. NCCP-2222]|uniref:hypothetical protein n=1 Tax=Sporosarcina TaxID=1569 RepID=UPI001EE0BA7E|nr:MULTISPECIES: hypothetical protein [Sporosarcina]MCG3088899.1 hypothetical protein [Sporosarcina cyprini]GKV57929.1 hypothetical protein NCCP2222_38760 [Sporosarcina sp. NCCP-2222]